MADEGLISKVLFTSDDVAVVTRNQGGFEKNVIQWRITSLFPE